MGRLTRRNVATGMAAAGLSACAPGSVIGPGILVNLVDQTPVPVVDGARLSLTADVAKRVTAPVYLNRQGPYEFVVDTGANRSVVAAELSAPLGLARGQSSPVHGIAGVEPAPTAVIDRLAVGDVVTRRLRTPLLARSRLGADGLLGVDVLKNRRVTMDFVANELNISPANSTAAGEPPRQGSRLQPPPDPSIVTVPARYRFGQLIIIDADVGGEPVTAFLDSGSQNTVGNLALARLVLRNPIIKAQTLMVQLMGVTGQTVSGELSPLPPLRMGGLVIGDMQAVFADLHVFDIWGLKAEPAILIGIDVMRHFNAIELNFGLRQVTFYTPPKRVRPTPPTPAPTPSGTP